MIHIFFWWHVTGSFMSFIKAILVGHVINQGRKLYNWRHARLTKESSLVYYKVRWTVITNCDSFLITKCDTVYYKLRQVLQSAMDLLQIATGITKCDGYYKLRQHPRSLLLTALYSLQFSAFTWLDIRRINYDSATETIPVFIEQRNNTIQYFIERIKTKVTKHLSKGVIYRG